MAGLGERTNVVARNAGALLWAALLLALAAPVLVLLGAVGTKLGLWNWRFGFGTMTVGWAPPAAMAGVCAMLVTAVVVAAFAGWRRLRRSWFVVLAGVLVPALTLGLFLSFRAQAQSVPPIHDYATDWSEPLTPSRQLLAARGPDANPVEADPRADLGRDRPEVESWADGRVSRIGAEACPRARPVTLPAPPAEAQPRIRQMLEGEGLDVLTDTPGSLEATETTFWYGFKDDVLVRIRPDGAGSLVDLRSTSRVGVSDLGANCARIVELSEALRG